LAISEDITAKILRYYHVEKWRVGTIAHQIGVHHTTVDRVLKQSGVTKRPRNKRGSVIDPFLPFILHTLEKFPKLTSSRLYDMVKERGYPGGPDHFRYLISLHRPRKVPEAYHRLKTLKGEQAQVDWGLCRMLHRPHYPTRKTMPHIHPCLPYRRLSCFLGKSHTHDTCGIVSH